MLSKVSNLYYFKSNIKITVVVQGAAQCYGQMVLAFTPQTSLAMETLSTATVATDLTNNLRIVPHLTLDPSKNETYELELPVSNPTGYYQSISDPNNHGSYLFEMHIVNPLRSGTAVASTVSVCVYMSLIDPEFEALTLSSNEYESEKLSDMTQSVSYFTSLISPFTGVFEPGVQLFSEVTGVAAKVLRWFGFSKPPQGDITAMALTRTCDNYSQIEGLSSAIVLGCSQKQSLAIDPAYGLGKFDDMAISSLVRHQSPILLDKAIDNSFSTESWVTSLVVHPLTSVAGNLPSPMAGISLVSQYWCGDLTYSFEFIASAFTRATILIAWDPFAIASASASAPVFSDALTVLQNTTVQVVGNTVVDITIPYKAYMPVLNANLSTAPIVPGTDGQPGYSNGMIYVYVINPVVDNGGSTTVAMNVWINSTNIAFLGSTNESLVTGDFGVLTGTLTSSGYEMAPSAPISFGNKTNLDTISHRVTGDLLRTIKDIISRMDYAFTANTSGDCLGLQVLVPNMPLVHTDLESVLTMTRFGWISSAFYAFRGSTKYTSYPIESYSTIDGTNGQIRCMAFHSLTTAVNTPFDTGSYTTTAIQDVVKAMAWTQPNLNVCSRLDYVTPMMIGNDFYPSRVFPSEYKDAITMNFEKTDGLSTSSNVGVSVYQGAGDDAVFSWFLGFPKIL